MPNIGWWTALCHEGVKKTFDEWRDDIVKYPGENAQYSLRKSLSREQNILPISLIASLAL